MVVCSRQFIADSSRTRPIWRVKSMPVTLTVNGQRHTLDIDDDTPLLWAIRDEIGLTGTKFGCGIGQCGACTLFVNGKPAR
ncbi:MAG TPA: 2Fe-2S iron-sulfur cluster-binding protein, partial [Hyphomicrobiales bacterium]